MREITVIGGTDSIGVPYSRDNKKHQGFFEQLVNYLSKEYIINDFSFYSLGSYNTSEYIKKILKENPSLEKIKTRQIKSIKNCKKSGFLGFIEVPKSFLSYYKVEESMKGTNLLDYLKRRKTLFIYSSGVNDFFKLNNIKLGNLLQKKYLRTVNNNIDKYLDNCYQLVEENIKKIIEINKDIKIIIIGLYTPTNLNYIRSSLKNIISKYNSKFKKIEEKYENVYFIETELEKGDFNNIDFHPNLKGHTKIFKKIEKKIGGKLWK